jgi:hypothetical protein
MHRIQAHQKVTTSLRSQPLQAARPLVEIRSTHAAVCVYCQREVRIIASATEAHIHAACQHIVRIERCSDLIEVVFDETPRRKRAGVGV